MESIALVVEIWGYAQAIKGLFPKDGAKDLMEAGVKKGGSFNEVIFINGSLQMCDKKVGYSS